MRKIMFLGVAVLLLSANLHCISPIGRRVKAPADGRFGAAEIKRLNKCYSASTDKYKIDDLYKILIDYANDMRVFIKKCVWKDWPGIDKMYVKIVPNRKELYKAWDHCTRFKKQNPGTKLAGFSCPYNNEVYVLKMKWLGGILEVFDHEEGHFINNLDGDVAEFPSEFNSRWKAVLRFALDKWIGNKFSAYFFAGGPTGPYKDNDTIKKMGIYKAAALMFFFVANHYDGDLTKAAKFVLLGKAKKLRRFFYRKLRKYKDSGLLMGQIWENETETLWNYSDLHKYIRKLRLKSRTCLNTR